MSGLVGFKSTPVTIVTGADEPGAKEWRFDNQGIVTLPLGGDIVDSNGASLLAVDGGTRRTVATVEVGTPTIVWTGYDSSVSSAKLFVQAECEIIGDPSGPHSQSCEIVIASRSNQFTPAISVYGVVYTSTAQIVTFTAQRNIATDRIEIIGTAAGIVTTNPLLRIYSVEQLTRIAL